MFTTFLASLNSDGVNKLGELKTVLENHLDVKIESIESERSIVDEVVLKTKLPLCFIIIKKNMDEDMVRLCYLNNTNNINWAETIYLVGIFGKYAIINNTRTPEKLIKRFESIKPISIPFENGKPVKHVVMKIYHIAELDQYDDFENLETFKKSFQSPSVQTNRSTRRIRFKNNNPPRMGNPSASKRSNGSYSRSKKSKNPNNSSRSKTENKTENKPVSVRRMIQL